MESRANARDDFHLLSRMCENANSAKFKHIYDPNRK